MSRALLLGVLAGWCFLPAAVWGQCVFVDPHAIGQQALAKLGQDGQIALRRTEHCMVCETLQREVSMVQTIEVDGQPKTEEVKKMVFYTVCKPVANIIDSSVAASAVQAFDMEGKPVAAERLSTALANQTMVLLATKQVPSYYLAVYKPDTILLVVSPQNLFAPPMPVARPPAPAEAPPPAPGSTAPPTSAPAPAAAAPAAPIPVGGPGPQAQQPAVSPIASLATFQEGTVGLRHHQKEITYETVSQPVTVGGVQKMVDVQIAVESVTDVERKYPQAMLQIQRADGQPVTAAEVAQLLSKSRCVLKSQNGKAIHPAFLKIVRPDALIVIPPVATPNFPAGVAPVAPAPAVAPAS